MKIITLALLLATFAVAADDLTEATKAAKEAKEKRKKSTTKVITNADVKKSKGKLVENKKPAPPVETQEQKSLVEQYQTSYRERAASVEKLAAARKKVAELERELVAIEQSYYEENDLDRRDREIVKKFADVQLRLDTARKELSALEKPGDGGQETGTPGNLQAPVSRPPSPVSP